MGQPGGRVGGSGCSPGGSREGRGEPGGRGGVREVRAERTVSSSGHSEIDNQRHQNVPSPLPDVQLVYNFPTSPLLDDTTARLIFQGWGKTKCLI